MGAGSRRGARGCGLQRADAVGERALVVVRRFSAVRAAFRARTIEVLHPRAPGLTAFGNRLRQHGFDRRTGAFEHGREAGHLGRDVIDPLAQERVLDPLGRPGGLRIALHGRNLALQPAAVLDRGG